MTYSSSARRPTIEIRFQRRSSDSSLFVRSRKKSWKRSVAAFNATHVDVACADMPLEPSVNLPVAARATREDVETERTVLRKSVNREVRLREQTESRNSARSGEDVPHRSAHDIQRQLVDDAGEQLGEAGLVREARGIAPARVNNPLDSNLP